MLFSQPEKQILTSLVFCNPADILCRSGLATWGGAPAPPFVFQFFTGIPVPLPAL